MGIVNVLRSITAPLARLGELLAGFAMFVIMLVAMTDVTARYVFNSPLPWSFDLIMWFMMPTVFFLALGSTGLRRDHVDIDVVYRFMPAWLQRLCAVVGATLSAALYFYVAYLGWERAGTAWRTGEIMNSALEWPTWIYLALVPLGVGLLVLVLVQQAATAATGGELTEPVGHIDVSGVK